MKKNIIYFFALGLLLFGFNTVKVHAQDANKSDFIGSWSINYDKSDFGQVPHYVMANKIQFSAALNSIAIKLDMQTAEGVDTTEDENLIVGKPLVSIGRDNRKRTKTVQTSADGTTLTITTVASFPNDPATQQYVVTETWNISGNELTIKKVVTTGGSPQYSVNAVYERSK